MHYFIFRFLIILVFMYNKTRTIIYFLLVFLPVLFAMAFIGKLPVTFEFVLAFVLMLFGLGNAYFAFEAKSKEFIFLGGTFFLAGVFLYLLERYILIDFFDIIIPAILLIVGFNFLLLYLNEPGKKKFILYALPFLLFPVGYMFFEGRIEAGYFLENLLFVINNLWFPVALVLLSLIIIILFER